MDILDKLSLLNLDIKNSGSRYIDPRKKMEYLSMFGNYKHREYVELVLRETKYIHHDEFKRNIKSLTDILKGEEFNLIYNSYCCNSEQWIAYMLWPQLKHGCKKLIDNYHDIDNKLPIVLIDDCVYSGGNLEYILSKFIDENPKPPQEFYILNSHVNPEVTNKITTDFREKNINIYFSYYDTITQQSSLFNGLFKDDIFDSFRSHKTSCPIYFDHKVGADVSSFPFIYLHGYIPEKDENYGSLLANDINRDHINIINNEMKRMH